LFKQYFIQNPEIIRHIRINFRFPRFLTFTLVYLLGLLSIYGFLYFSMNFDGSFVREDFAKVCYVITVGIEYLMYFYIAAYFSAHSIAQEKEKGTFDFLRLSIIDKKVLAVGKLFGAPIFLSFLILVSLPFVFFFAYLGQIPLINLFTVNLNLLIYGIFFHTLGLFCAIVAEKSTSANALALALPVIFTFNTLAFSVRTSNPFYVLFSTLRKTPGESPLTIFYGFNVYSFLVMGGVIVYLTAWCLLALIRKLESENNKILSKRQSLFFLLFSELILLGFLWDRLVSGVPEVLLIFYIISLVLVILLIAVLNTSREDYFIYLNKLKVGKVSFLEEKRPIFALVIIFNLMILGLAIGANGVSIIANKSAPILLFKPVVYSLIFFFFTYLYSQIFFLVNIVFGKNTTAIIWGIITISLFVPVPLNFLTTNQKELTDLFIFNPFIALYRVDWSLATLSQFLLIGIIMLVVNALILGKKEKFQEKYVIQ